MRTRLSFIAVLAFLSLTLPALAEEPEFPRSDFTLIGGRMRKLEDATPQYNIERIVFASTPIEVRDGRISVKRTSPVTVSETFGDPRYEGRSEFIGEETVAIEGDYDKDTGAFAGSVAVDVSLITETSWKDGGKTVMRTDGPYSESGTGTFRGQIVGNKALLKFSWSSWTSEGTTSTSVRNVAYEVDVRRNAPAASAEEPAARREAAAFSGVTGQVEIHYPDEPEDVWHLVTLDTPVPRLARIRTAEDSIAVIGFADMSTFVMKPESEMVVLTPPEKESKLKLVAGNIWVNIKSMMKDGRMEVEMNQAVAGIKGTTFVASEVDGRSEVRVIEGAVELRPSKGGEAERIEAGRSGSVGEDAVIAIASFDAVAEQDSWDELRPIDWDAFAAVPDPAEGASEAPEARGARPGGGLGLVPIVGVAVLMACCMAAFAHVRRKKRA